MAELFSSDGFMPHGYCYLWNPALVWLHVISDLLIALAYTTIPFTLVYIIRKRRDVPFRSIFLWFGLFIVSCGATHVFEAWNLYHAHYWLAGLAKAFTAVASLATAFLLVRIVPEATALPSPDDLRRLNEALRESEQRYRMLVETAREIIVTVDLEGRFTSFNVAFETLTGLTRAEWLGRPFRELVHPDDVAVCMAVFEATLRGEAPPSATHRLPTRGGGWLTFETTATPQLRDGRMVGAFGVARDVTDRRRMEEEREAFSRRLVRLQEDERSAISRELHDEVGQLLTGLRLMIDHGDAAGTADRRPEMKRVVNEVIGRVRDISMSLRPPMLDELGLLATLLWQIERFEKQTDIAVEFRHANLDRRFPRQIELAAFRVVQEALTNVARHAEVARVGVEVWATNETLGARIEDRGRGFDVATALGGASSGLSGIRERCRLLEGMLRVESSPGDGARLLVELPVDERSKVGTL